LFSENAVEDQYLQKTRETGDRIRQALRDVAPSYYGFFVALSYLFKFQQSVVGRRGVSSSWVRGKVLERPLRLKKEVLISFVNADEPMEMRLMDYVSVYFG